MARPRRRSQTGIRHLTDMQKSVLFGDFDFKGDEKHFESEDEQRAAWFQHRDQLLREYREGHHAWVRPRAWWRFESELEDRPLSKGGELVALINAGELTDAEESLLRRLTISQAREVVAGADLNNLPDPIRRCLTSHGGLFTTLTPKGIRHYLDRLPPAVREEVIHRQGIDYDSLPQEEA